MGDEARSIVRVAVRRATFWWSVFFGTLAAFLFSSGQTPRRV